MFPVFFPEGRRKFTSDLVAAISLLENKIEPSKFEGLIDFIRQLMNRSSPHLASVIQECCEGLSKVDGF